MNDQSAVPTDRNRKRTKPLDITLGQRRDRRFAPEHFLLVVPPDAEHVLRLSDSANDTTALGSLSDQITDEHDEVVASDFERRKKSLERVRTTVYVPDDVGVLPRCEIESQMIGGDVRIEIGSHT